MVSTFLVRISWAVKHLQLDGEKIATTVDDTKGELFQTRIYSRKELRMKEAAKRSTNQ